MRKAVVAGFVVLALAFGTGRAFAAACLGDRKLDFSIGTLASWLVAGTSATGGNSGARVVDGGLSIHRPAGIHVNGSSNATLAETHEICGDFDIRVDFDVSGFAPPAPGKTRYATLMVREKNGGDFVGIERFLTGATRLCVPYLSSYKVWRNSTEDCPSTFIATDRTRGRFRVTRRNASWTIHHWGNRGWRTARTVRAGRGPVTFALYAGGDSPDSQQVRFDNLEITSDGTGRPAARTSEPPEGLPAARRALDDGRVDEAMGIAAELLFTMSRTEPDTALADQAQDLMLAAGACHAAGVRCRARRPSPIVRADTLGAIRRIEDHATGLIGLAHHRVAARLLERSLALRAAMGLADELWTAEALHSLGRACWTLGDYTRSLSAFVRARPIYVAFEGPHGRAHSVESNRALQHMSLGELGEARRMWETLVAEFEAHHRDRMEHLSTFYVSLGEVYQLLGEDPRLAGRMFERCMELRAAAGLGREWLGDPLMSLAGTFTAAGEPARALGLLDSLVNAHVVRDDKSNIGWVELHRAEALRATGRLDEASLMADKARDFLETTWGFDHIGLRDAYQALAKIRIAQRDWPRAVAAAESAVVLAQRWLPDPHPDQARSLLLLAQATAGSAQGGSAFAMALDAERRLREALRILAPELSEGAAFRIDRDRGRALAVAQDALPAAGQVRDLLDAVVRSRGLILDLRVARLPAAGGDPTGRALREDFARACTRLSNLAMRPRERSRHDEDRSAIEGAIAARRRAELALAAHSTTFSRQQIRGAAGLDDVLQALPAGAALVSFVRLGPARPDGVSLHTPMTSAGRYAAFVVPPGGGAPVHLPLGEADRLDRLIERWRVAVAGRAAPAQAGADLRRAIWDPLVAHLAGASSIVVVPDGALQHVNLGTLPVGGGRFLVETAPPILTLGTERDLVRPRNAAAGDGLFALGGVDYQQASPIPAQEPVATATGRRRDTYRSARTSCGNFTQLRLDPLPASLAEVAEIASIWRAAAPDSTVRLLTGPGASEDRLKALAPAHRFLHLATHGFFLGPECDSTESAGDVLRESPMLRSGLALSGFNTRGQAAPDDEDGVLTAEEVAALDLGGVDCVVLSACESGLGMPTAGEGVLGLRRAFQIAGARTLVTSLWPVEDHAARAWMRLFHRHYASGRSPGEAATRASRAMLAELRRHGRPTSPADWGAFLVVGN